LVREILFMSGYDAGYRHSFSLFIRKALKGKNIPAQGNSLRKENK